MRAQLARVVHEQGHDAEALELVDQAEQEGTGENIRFQLQWRTAAGARVVAGRGETVERLAREVVAIVAATDYINAHADALVDLGEVLRAGGNEAEAAAALEMAVALYEEKGNALCADRARAAIASAASEL